jgi:hypothetical protein
MSDPGKTQRDWSCHLLGRTVQTCRSGSSQLRQTQPQRISARPAQNGQTRVVLFPLADARRVPSGAKATKRARVHARTGLAARRSAGEGPTRARCRPRWRRRGCFRLVQMASDGLTFDRKQHIRSFGVIRHRNRRFSFTNHTQRFYSRRFETERPKDVRFAKRASMNYTQKNIYVERWMWYFTCVVAAVILLLTGFFIVLERIQW